MPWITDSSCNLSVWLRGADLTLPSGMSTGARAGQAERRLVRDTVPFQRRAQGSGRISNSPETQPRLFSSSHCLYARVSQCTPSPCYHTRRARLRGEPVQSETEQRGGQRPSPRQYLGVWNQPCLRWS